MMQTIKCLVSVFALYFFAAPTVTAAAFAVEEKRQACNQDNVLRALEANTPQASYFCQTFANIPYTTVVGHLSTVTPVIIPYVETIFYVTYPGPSPTYSTTPLPTYVSGYPTSRVSSGCSCLIPQASRTTTANLGPYGSTTETTSTTTTSITAATNPCSPLQNTFPGVYHNDGGNGVAPFMEFIPNSPSAQACCNTCNFNATYENCITWMYNPNADPSVACTLFESAQTSTNLCPNGLQSSILSSNVTVYPANSAGLGKCASEVFLLKGPA